MAEASQTGKTEKDCRFIYEPLLKGHPAGPLPETTIGGKKLKAPLWISSMTGGTIQARKINQNLANAAAEFGLGMGLGSCNALIKDDRHLPDYDLRPIIGDKLPFYANLGIAQIEQYIENGKVQDIRDMVALLNADGLIVHVNPIQERFQSEGDVIASPPIETIRKLLDEAEFNIIVKEVGQGMGKESLKALLELPLTAIEFGAFGGTNFAKLELDRSPEANSDLLEPLAYIGQTAEEMTLAVNQLIEEKVPVKAGNLIISGGLKNFLDGYYLINISRLPAVYGMASQFLSFARVDYQNLKKFTETQLEGLRMAYAYLRIV